MAVKETKEIKQKTTKKTNVTKASAVKKDVTKAGAVKKNVTKTSAVKKDAVEKKAEKKVAVKPAKDVKIVRPFLVSKLLKLKDNAVNIEALNSSYYKEEKIQEEYNNIMIEQLGNKIVIDLPMLLRHTK